MHWVSLLLLAIPLGYVLAINGEPFWLAFTILWVQVGSMVAMRLIGVGYVKRAWLLIPIVPLSVFVAAAVAVWQADAPLALQFVPWTFLVLSALAFALSGVLSLYSFPVGYGERSR